MLLQVIKTLLVQYSGKVKNVKVYVVKALQNEFGSVDDNKTYRPPESIRKQLQVANSHQLHNLEIETAQAEKPSEREGLGVIGEHITKMLPQKTTRKQSYDCLRSIKTILRVVN